MTSIKHLHVSAPWYHPHGVFYNKGIPVQLPNLSQSPYLVQPPNLA